MVVMGAEHNFLWGYEPDQSSPWVQGGFSDCYDGIFDRADRRVGYGTAGFPGIGQLLPTVSNPTRKIAGFGGGVTLDYTGEPRAPITPLFADEANNQYAGMHHVMHRNGGLGNFGQSNIPFIALPTHANNDPGIMTKMDFDSYKSGTTNAAGYLKYNSGQLLYCNPAASISSFVERPYPNPGSPITDICAKPGNAQKVWLARGGINWDNQPKGRVHYSEDGGVIWRDISKGLPLRVPATNIVYQEASNFVYVSTDLGIYRCDMSNYNGSSDALAYNSVEWTCFYKGQVGGPDFPNVHVTDLEINYCSGQLLASAYGRALWATPLWDTASRHIPTPTTVITANTTWTGNKYMTGSVRVKPGVTLTISGTTANPTIVRMPSEGIIHIEPGGKLIVDKAKLTNACKDCMWKGIEARGPGTGGVQSAATSGTVDIRNGSTIEHARVAVSNRQDSTGVVASNTTGGIVQVRNSTFLNNTIGVELKEFEGAPTSYGTAVDKSFVTGSSFDLDNNYRGHALGKPFVAHINLDRVYGVAVSGNAFNNHHTYNSLSAGRGAGIASFGGTYRVVPLCNSITPLTQPCPAANLTRNTFEHLYYGVWAIGTNDYPANVAVDQAKFTKTSVGVFLDGANTASVLRSEFVIGNALHFYGVNCDQNIGVAARGPMTFRVEENEFKYGGNVHPRYGVTVDGTGILNKQVYKNSISGMNYGIHSQGTNGSTTWPSGSGLLVTCNAFNNNDSDFVAYGYYVPPPSNNPVSIQYLPLHPRQYDGVGGAGNTFPANGGKIRYWGTGYFSPQYRHSGGNTLPASSPGFAMTAVSGTATCASRIPTGGTSTYVASAKFSSGALDSLESGFLDALAGKAASLGSLTGLIDGGDTRGLLGQIEGAATSTAYDLQQALLAASPYLSEEVLRAAVTADVMTLKQTMELLVANPDVLRSRPFMLFLEEEAPSPFPSDALEDLQTASLTISERGEAEDEVMRKGDSAYLCATLLMADLALDSTGGRYDNIASWYGMLPFPAARFAKAGYHFRRGQYETAVSEYEKVSNDFTLSAPESRERQAYSDMLAILTDMKAENELLSQMAPGRVVQMEALSADSNGGAAYGARTLARIAGLTTISRCFRGQVSPPPVLRRAPRTGVWQRPATLNTIEASPNPSSDAVTFRYSLPVRNGSVLLTISDAAGRVVRSYELKDDKGKEVWDVRSVVPGIYLYSVRDAVRNISEGKVVVSR